uniref:Glycosyltransferase n=1 Tax=Oryza punctata TaxID=4537 RepID=A0A0E0LKT1_ORYPU
MAAAHVLVFPFPAQGHMNCMMHFATGLLGAGLHPPRLGDAAAALAAGSRRLHFMSVPDGLPDDHARAVGDFLEHMELLRTKGSVAYRVLLTSLVRAGDDSAGFPPVTCVVADLSIPRLSIPRLFELGELPFPAGGDLDEPVRGVPGMENFLRRRDLPSFSRGCGNPMLQKVNEDTAHSRKARALVLNTAASMEGPALAHIAPNMRDVFAIGPLHTMFPAPAAAGSLWRADDGCMAWLDVLPDRSVVYMSLGSLTVISLEQFTEFLHGLVAAGYPFLWVLRPDMSAALREAITAAGDSKARVVEWAPQLDVLRHRAVGCFLTHAGWNSTLEAAVEGVPTVCWPFFADQQMNSRFVGGVWRTGLDMKDVCDRAVVERMVREAMESGEIRASAQALARQLRRDVADDCGSSAAEFQRLVGFIKVLSLSMADTGQ